MKLTFDESLDHIKLNYKKDYPRVTGQRRNSNIGNLPKELHTDIVEAAKEARMSLAEYLAALMDFKDQFAEQYAEELEALAKTKGAR